MQLIPSPPSTVAGSPGNIWTTVEIEVDNVNGVISYRFDGALTFRGDFDGMFNGAIYASLAIAIVIPITVPRKPRIGIAQVTVRTIA